MDIGDVVKDFELPDQNGTLRRLSSMLEEGPVVLFFYPAAMSKGCTVEVCHFRDLAGEFRATGAQPVGISADDVSKQQQFAGANDVPFPLLSDKDKLVAEQFGVRRRLGLPVKRHTFVISPDSTVLEVISSELSMEAHADRALEVLRQG
ncbi:peroxiredoxin [Phytoactinopolyspora alkaliphila]|uniref:thioredoxin-dependent peroxiredoxin n=1 Tax=Phytoactinopolyspora alkaliphila TaxID=1783498 RepID=A0A6N9YKP9_9ACTN|nr:peroxiredoxin [Phytoactinopolyspora alkaliphila]NED95515.1 peroxiredoxin [Phytoactinopolyspora alkaliphila]